MYNGNPYLSQNGSSSNNPSSPYGGVGAPQTLAGLGIKPVTNSVSMAPTQTPSIMSPYAPGAGNPLLFQPAGAPGAPTYTAGYNPMTMGISGDVNAALSGINPDMSGLNKFRTEAERTGPSTWANLANAQQDTLAQQYRQQAARETAGSAANAGSQLAMTGGLSSGARERIGRDSSRNYLASSQNISHDLGVNKEQIGINDEQNRIQQLGSLPGMENAAMAIPLQKAGMTLQGRQFDIQNQMNELQRQNLWNMNIYGQQMGGWAGQQQGNAIAMG